MLLTSSEMSVSERLATWRLFLLAGVFFWTLSKFANHETNGQLFGVGATAIATTISAPASSARLSTNNISSSNNSSNPTANPYWRRPGCHQVGHTRTISIPGCVKFNLSTNACRGFCLSFSIPAAEDIGPPTQPLIDADSGQLVELVSLADLGASVTEPASNLRPATSASGHSGRQQAKWVAAGPSNLRQQHHQLASSPAAGAPAAAATLDELAHLGGTKSPLAGAIGNTNDKRDVVSVGQCCSMMETEDVTVNLRCGLNETRRLVFKSAKTCECFFCKHI